MIRSAGISAESRATAVLRHFWNSLTYSSGNSEGLLAMNCPMGAEGASPHRSIMKHRGHGMIRNRGITMTREIPGGKGR